MRNSLSDLRWPSLIVAAAIAVATVPALASAKLGDEVTAVGNRSQDQTEHRMKALRIIVNSKTYDVYPDRAPTN